MLVMMTTMTDNYDDGDDDVFQDCQTACIISYVYKPKPGSR